MSESQSCALCGHRFRREEALEPCGACALHSGCGAICCPRCGYSFVNESRIWNWIRRLLGR
jgi:hypothetical protein